MQLLLENTTFLLHKVTRTVGIIRDAGIIRGRFLYEEIRYYQLLLNCLIIRRKVNFAYRISSYKALPRIIPATLIIPSILTILCSKNVVFSNKTRIWRLCKIIIPAGLIWGNTVYEFDIDIILYWQADLLHTVFPHIRPAGIIVLHSLQMRVLLENTTFPLHKIVRIAGIIRVAGIIRGRALYEEIR